MNRIIELAEHFEALAKRIPGENDPSQPWQDEVVEAVGECFDSKADALTDLVRSSIPVTRVAAFKGALRKLRERVGRYSPSSNQEIAAALHEITSTFTLIRASIAGHSDPCEESAALARPSSLSADVVTLMGKLYEWDQQRPDTNATFNTKGLAEALGWAPERMNRAVRALEQQGLARIEYGAGTTPFQTRGVRLHEAAILAWESRHSEVDPSPAAGEDEPMSVSTPDPKKVFIIHGRNVAARNAVEQFVRSIGLEPLDFDQVSADLGGSPFVGEVVCRGMELAQGIIALFTPDEFSALRPSFLGAAEKPDDVQRWQSRPNVIFEAGMAYGMTPKRAVLVTLGAEVALFSDVAGIHVVRLDNTVGSRGKLRQKLIGMKCSVDERPDAWTDFRRSGDFETCVNGLPEVSTRSPFADQGQPTGIADGVAPAPGQVAPGPMPGVSLHLSYRKLPTSNGEIHHYELAAVLRNGGKKRIDDWYLEVELPTPLEEPHMTVGTRVRSQGGVTLFRTSDRLNPILVGEEFRYTIPYRMDNDVFDRFQDALAQWVATGRAFVGGEQVAEVVLREIQNF